MVRQSGHPVAAGEGRLYHRAQRAGAGHQAAGIGTETQGCHTADIEIGKIATEKKRSPPGTPRTQGKTRGKQNVYFYIFRQQPRHRLSHFSRYGLASVLAFPSRPWRPWRWIRLTFD